MNLYTAGTLAVLVSTRYHLSISTLENYTTNSLKIYKKIIFILTPKRVQYYGKSKVLRQYVNRRRVKVRLLILRNTYIIRRKVIVSKVCLFLPQRHTYISFVPFQKLIFPKDLWETHFGELGQMFPCRRTAAFNCQNFIVAGFKCNKLCVTSPVIILVCVLTFKAVLKNGVLIYWTASSSVYLARVKFFIFMY